jgi:hypothetical protein
MKVLLMEATILTFIMILVGLMFYFNLIVHGCESVAPGINFTDSESDGLEWSRLFD